MNRFLDIFSHFTTV